MRDERFRYQLPDRDLTALDLQARLLTGQEQHRHQGQCLLRQPHALRAWHHQHGLYALSLQLQWHRQP